MLRAVAPPHVLLAAYCAGLLLALASKPAVWLLVAIAMAGVVVCIVAQRSPSEGLWSISRSEEGCGAAEGEFGVRMPRPAMLTGLALVLLAAGLGVGDLRLGALEGSDLAGRVGSRVAITGVLTDLPDIEDDQVTLTLAVRSVAGGLVDEPAHLRLQLGEGERLELDPTGSLTEGALVDVSGVRVRALPEAEPGVFDYGRYLRRRGEHVLLDADFSELRIVGHRGGIGGMMDALRRASRSHLQTGLTSPVREVVQGMVLGDDEGVDEQLIEDFRRSGLLHIMAVSGENVVLLCGMWTFAFVLLAIPRLARTALLVPVVATYVVLTGASPSIVRAGVAGIIGLLAILASRPSDGWLLWLAPAAWLLSANPNNIFDVSFQLSFGAVAGLLVLARPLTRVFGFLPAPLPEQVGVTTAASLATAPVSMAVFGSTSLVSIPANVVGGFVLGPIMFLGMLSLLLGFVSSWLSLPLNLVAGLFIGFLLTVARFFGRLPWAVYEWQGVTLELALVGVVVALAAGVCVLARRAGESPLAYVRSPSRAAPLVALAALCVAATLLVAPVGPAAPAQPTLTFLDVGEGAATLLQAPSGQTVLVDAGPAPLARTLREHGVRRIDLLVVSHGHADHIAGLSDVIGNFPISVALLPQPPEPSPALEQLAADIAAAGGEVRRLSCPASMSGDGWGIRVLPTYALGGGGDANQDENDNALVVLAALADQRVLLPGDVEGAALAALDLPSCSVVGVPHHGSAGGFDAALLADLSPALAVIPVGPNRHGHPTAEMLRLFAAEGVPCVRTDERGDVAVCVGPGGLEVNTERTP